MTKPESKPEATPSSLGYSMPAEWAPHKGCWMAWPARRPMWVDRIEGTCRNYAAVAQAIARFEPVTMIAPPAFADEARAHCGPTVAVLELDIDDSWARDSGPIFVKNQGGEIAGTAWGFNAWGSKYEPYDKDATLAPRLLSTLGVDCFTAPMVLEGGAIHVDGEGTLLTTESCLLNKNRNPDLTRAQIETILHDFLGIEKVIWLPGDPLEVETDGHVDGIACFVRPGVVLFESWAEPGDPDYAAVEKNRRALEQATDAKGRKLEIFEIQDAAECEEEMDERFCRSYVNFYIANGGIVMPGYGIPADAINREVLQKLFPDREVVQVPIRDVAIGGGGIHCITQQQPA